MAMMLEIYPQVHNKPATRWKKQGKRGGKGKEWGKVGMDGNESPGMMVGDVGRGCVSAEMV